MQAGEIWHKRKYLHGSSALILYCHKLVADACVQTDSQAHLRVCVGQQITLPLGMLIDI